MIVIVAAPSLASWHYTADAISVVRIDNFKHLLHIEALKFTVPTH